MSMYQVDKIKQFPYVGTFTRTTNGDESDPFSSSTTSTGYSGIVDIQRATTLDNSVQGANYIIYAPMTKDNSGNYTIDITDLGIFTATADDRVINGNVIKCFTSQKGYAIIYIKDIDV